jgi:hypothetical protein
MADAAETAKLHDLLMDDIVQPRHCLGSAI